MQALKIIKKLFVLLQCKIVFITEHTQPIAAKILARHQNTQKKAGLIEIQL